MNPPLQESWSIDRIWYEMPVTLTVMPADCAVSEGLPPSPYLALLGVAVISGVILWYCFWHRVSWVCGRGCYRAGFRHFVTCADSVVNVSRHPATRIETSHFSKNFDAVDADADDENRGDCCRKDFSALAVADGYAVGFLSGAVAKFERKINMAP